MPEKPLSRRVFLASSGALTAATQVSAQTRQAVPVEDRTQPGPRVSGDAIRILTLSGFDPHELDKIQAAAPQVEVTIAKTREEFRQKLPQAEVVFGGLNGADLDYAPKVKWVQAGGAGVENLDPNSRRARSF